MRLLVIIVAAVLPLFCFGQVTPSSYPYPKPFPTTGATPAVGGVKRSSSFQPAAYDQDSPIAWDMTVGGGYRIVGTEAERDTINVQWRKEGMLVFVVANGREYRLSPDLSTWVEAPRSTTGKYRSNGVIANDTFDASMNGWTAFGTTSWTVTAGKLIVSGGGDPTFFSDRIERNIITASERWQMEADITAPNPLPAASAVLLGVKSIVDSYPRDTWGLLSMGTGGQYGAGKMSIWSASNASGTKLNETTFSLPLAAGDLVKFRVKRARNELIVSARNITQGSGWNSLSYVFPDSNAAVMHNTGHFSICTSGGDWSLDNLRITDDMPLSPDVVVLGDSISYGVSGGVDGVGASHRFADWLGRLMGGKVSVLSGSGDRTQDIIQRLGEVTNKNPQTVIVFAGTNDADTGVSLATTQTNLITIRNACLSTGAAVVMVTPLPRNAVSTIGIRDWLTTNGWNRIADPHPYFSVTGASGYRTDLLTDGIHPTAEGHKIIAHSIITALDQ